MSRENVEVMRVAYGRLNRTGQLDREAYAFGVTVDASRLAGFGFYRGFDEFDDAWVEYRDTFDEWWIEVEELLDAEGDRVRDGGRMKASGGEVRQQVFHLSELRSGKIVATTLFLDHAEALEAAGLSE